VEPGALARVFAKGFVSKRQMDEVDDAKQSNTRPRAGRLYVGLVLHAFLARGDYSRHALAGCRIAMVETEHDGILIARERVIA